MRSAPSWTRDGRARLAPWRTRCSRRRDGAVLTITFNRPEVYNAFNRELHAALGEALDEAADAAVRCVVVTGAGKGFCAGQDLKEFGSVSASIQDALEQTYHPNVRRVRSLEKPVIAAVNGPAAGAGLSFACACDVRVASESATFVPGFIGIGLVPDAGGTWFVHRLLGFARSFEWMTSNTRLSAAEALEWGLVSEVVPAGSFEARVAELAASGPHARRSPSAARSGSSIMRPRRRSRRSSRSRPSCSRHRPVPPTSRKASTPSWRRGRPSSPAPDRTEARMSETIEAGEDYRPPHPIQLVVTDDLRRNRLTCSSA